MNFMAKYRLLMSRFKIPKAYHKTLETILTNLKGEIYVFSTDGYIIATSTRKFNTMPIRASVRSSDIVERFPRGVAVTTDGIKIIEGEGKASKGFIEVMKFLNEFNKEAHARSNPQARRNGVNQRPRQSNKSDNSTD